MKGSVHIVASRGYVDYVLHDQRAHDLLNWTKKTKVPDETFFATLNHNPVLGVPGSYKGLIIISMPPLFLVRLSVFLFYLTVCHFNLDDYTEILPPTASNQLYAP